MCVGRADQFLLDQVLNIRGCEVSNTEPMPDFIGYKGFEFSCEFFDFHPLEMVEGLFRVSTEKAVRSSGSFINQ